GGAIAPLPTSQTYVVQQGDKMVYLAASFGVDLLCLARTNAIGNPDYLRVGETLRINYAECRITSTEVADAFH
ncbi:MAG: LysM domain-containing protein, partial [Anaerolineae bacterium]|nr:LysM domain-containing protein [Anaerolineae bacterium]